MVERTAAEVLAEKIQAIYAADPSSASRGWTERVEYIAARLAEDPAVTVRTDMVVERFVVEFHYDSKRYPSGTPLHWADEVREALTTNESVNDFETHRIIVRPYPEATDA